MLWYFRSWLDCFDYKLWELQWTGSCTLFISNNKWKKWVYACGRENDVAFTTRINSWIIFAFDVATSGRKRTNVYRMLNCECTNCSWRPRTWRYRRRNSFQLSLSLSLSALIIMQYVVLCNVLVRVTASYAKNEKEKKWFHRKNVCMQNWIQWFGAWKICHCKLFIVYLHVMCHVCSAVALEFCTALLHHPISRTHSAEKVLGMHCLVYICRFYNRIHDECWSIWFSTNWINQRRILDSGHR